MNRSRGGPLCLFRLCINSRKIQKIYNDLEASTECIRIVILCNGASVVETSPVSLPVEERDEV